MARRFSPESPVTEWLDDGRRMKLLNSITYTDRVGMSWTAPAGMVTDGASIPRFFWRFIGSPYSGRYRAAALIHDAYCIARKKNRPSKMTHKMLYEAARDCGTGLVRSWLIWLAVRIFGPRW